MSLADPTKKMSKSLGDKHYIGVFESEESIRKKVKTAVTDIGGQPAGEMSPGVSNLFTIIRACGNMDVWNSLMKDYNGGVLKYKDLKDAAADSLVKTLKPFRERREELNSGPGQDQSTCKGSFCRGTGICGKTLNEVKALTGLIRV